jgi:cytochrome c oxidase cbb3-type subunit I/II
MSNAETNVKSNIETFYYDNKIVRDFGIATVVWGIIGFLVGLIVALKLVFPSFLNMLPELSYGRLRPLHTNAVVFAFACIIRCNASARRVCTAMC